MAAPKSSPTRTSEMKCIPRIIRDRLTANTQVETPTARTGEPCMIASVARIAARLACPEGNECGSTRRSNAPQRPSGRRRLKKSLRSPVKNVPMTRAKPAFHAQDFHGSPHRSQINAAVGKRTVKSAEWARTTHTHHPFPAPIFRSRALPSASFRIHPSNFIRRYYIGDRPPFKSGTHHLTP